MFSPSLCIFQCLLRSLHIYVPNPETSGYSPAQSPQRIYPVCQRQQSLLAPENIASNKTIHNNAVKP